MRQRSPNQKAVEKLSTFLFEVKGRLANDEKVNFSQLYIKYNISKSTLSVLRKLKYIIDGESSIEWSNPANDSLRTMSLKILEYLRQQSDKQSDKPISDLWVAEINSIKSLLSEIGSNTKDRATGLKSTSISERVFLAGQIAGGVYNRVFPFILNPSDGASFDEANTMIVKMTDDLLKKLNQ